jgi:hypothetical protein
MDCGAGTVTHKHSNKRRIKFISALNIEYPPAIAIYVDTCKIVILHMKCYFNHLYKEALAGRSNKEFRIMKYLKVTIPLSYVTL